MKKILILFVLFISIGAYAQTKIYNQPVKYKVTPNLPVIDRMLTKDVNDLLSETTIDDFKTQIGLSTYLQTLAFSNGGLTISGANTVDLDTRYYTESETDNLLNSKLNLTGGILTGDLTAPNFIGNGSQLTGVAKTNVDNNFSVKQTVNGGLVVGNSTVTEGEYVDIKLYNSTNPLIEPRQWIRAYRGSIFGLGSVSIGVNTNEVVSFNADNSSDFSGTVTSNVTKAQIDAASPKVLPTKEWVQDTVAGLPTGFYEEGTFTPELVDVGAGATYSFTTESADYVRVGNMVTVNVRLISINTTGTPTGFLNLDSPIFNTLPPVNSDIWAGVVNTFTGGSVNYYSIGSQFGDSGFFFEYQNSLDNNNQSVISSTTITGGIIHVSVTYKTNVYTP